MSRLFALVMILLSFPLLVAIGLVQISVFRHVFFTQQRPGLQGRLFRLYKFQTMREGSHGIEVPAWGRFLRRSSLDELPQLWNILCGNMNFVGPRPLLPEYLPLYNERQRRRHQVKPGLTGWAQVQGGNALSWQEQLELDVCYVEQRSFRLDLRILVLTLRKLISPPKGETTIREAFNGRN